MMSDSKGMRFADIKRVVHAFESRQGHLLDFQAKTLSDFFVQTVGLEGRPLLGRKSQSVCLTEMLMGATATDAFTLIVELLARQTAISRRAAGRIARIDPEVLRILHELAIAIERERIQCGMSDKPASRSQDAAE
jgi:hypothetical protein